MKTFILFLLALFSVGTASAATYANSATTNAEPGLITFIQSVSGGPTNGITAVVATNIAAYQAKIATNDLNTVLRADLVATGDTRGLRLTNNNNNFVGSNVSSTVFSTYDQNNKWESLGGYLVFQLGSSGGVKFGQGGLGTEDGNVLAATYYGGTDAFYGGAPHLTNANATLLFGSGTVPPARLGTGSGGATKFLREDSSWQTVSGGGGGGGSNALYYPTGTNAVDATTAISGTLFNSPNNILKQSIYNSYFDITASNRFYVTVENGEKNGAGGAPDGQASIFSDGNYVRLGDPSADGSTYHNWLDFYGVNGITFHGPIVNANYSLVVSNNGVTTTIASNRVDTTTFNTTDLNATTVNVSGVVTLTNASNQIAATLTNVGGTANTFAVHDPNKKLIATAASSILATTLTDETGTGVAVFGTAPTFTTSITTPQIYYPTNANTTTPDFTKGLSLLSTNAAFTWLAPSGVDTTKTLGQIIVINITNTTASSVAMTPPANCHGGTGYVTNWTRSVWSFDPNLGTNVQWNPIF